MPTLYVTTQGAKVRKRSRLLVIEKGGEDITSIPLIKLERMVIFGNVNLTTPALSTLLRKGIDTVFLTRRGRFKGRLVGEMTGNGLLRQLQYKRTLDDFHALRMAKQMVRGKLLNQRMLLAQRNKALRRSELTEAIERIDELGRSIGRKRTIKSLMGVEGRGTAVYFEALRSMLRQKLGFKRRERRPPPDPINALLSLGYTLLEGEVRGAVQTVGLDPYIGFLHGPRYNRPSLVLDLMEEWRPVIVDRLVLKVINEGLLTEEDFELTDDGERPVRITDPGMKRFLTAYERQLAEKGIYLGERTDYRRMIELQARHLVHCLQGDDKLYEPFLLVNLN